MLVWNTLANAKEINRNSVWFAFSFAVEPECMKAFCHCTLITKNTNDKDLPSLANHPNHYWTLTKLSL